MMEKYFVLAFILFIMGLIGILKRQNLIMLFISSEILLNAANLALIVTSKMHENLDGQVFALFIMGIAACEIAVGVALCVLWYRKTGSLEFKSLKERGN
ncbi:NADH-quinone oxidoreductase subunit NuoK [Campylobacter sp. CCS1377]|uniref:NADH-quinone oxidoreductase subunit K n=1 Tax=Campylobacter sp. CCS1377 TaxID=3158229 RepID=A0AAU7E9I0_9BACT|nr:NADH-quinone oxidoreductase subunit NuoK [Campylobacter jejuni]